MAIFKGSSLLFDTGRQLRRTTSISISSNLEVFDDFGGDIFTSNLSHFKDAKKDPVLNPFNLTQDEVIELADCMAILWLKLKENVTKFGVNNEKIFIDTT